MSVGSQGGKASWGVPPDLSRSRSRSPASGRSTDQPVGPESCFTEDPTGIRMPVLLLHSGSPSHRVPPLQLDMCGTPGSLERGGNYAVEDEEMNMRQFERKPREMRTLCGKYWEIITSQGNRTTHDFRGSVREEPIQRHGGLRRQCRGCLMMRGGVRLISNPTRNVQERSLGPCPALGRRQSMVASAPGVRSRKFRSLEEDINTALTTNMIGHPNS